MTTNLKKCFNLTCNQPGILYCSKCLEVGFPPLSICSTECWQLCYQEHFASWHNNTSEYIAQAIPLIEVRNQETDTASILLAPHGYKLLKNMCQSASKVRIISILGPSRSGKSSRMNWLLQTLGINSNFKVVAGTKPVTSGIWMWGQPISLNDGTSLILLDSEGTQRGRDSVTAIVTSLSAELASCVIINMKGGLNNSIINFSNKLAHTTTPLPSSKRELIYWCNDINETWKQQTGNLYTYLHEQIDIFSHVHNIFNISLETSVKPNDTDLTIKLEKPQDIKALGSPFYTNIRTVLDQLIVYTLKAPYYNGNELFDRLEKTLNKYISADSGLLPSLITQIHKQEAETELQSAYASYEKYVVDGERLIPYFPESYDMNLGLKYKQDAILIKFRDDCNYLKLSSPIIDECYSRLQRQMEIRRNTAVLSWNNHIAIKQRQKAEEERIKRQEELRQQEEQQSKQPLVWQPNNND